MILSGDDGDGRGGTGCLRFETVVETTRLISLVVHMPVVQVIKIDQQPLLLGVTEKIEIVRQESRLGESTIQQGKELLRQDGHVLIWKARRIIMKGDDKLRFACDARETNAETIDVSTRSHNGKRDLFGPVGLASGHGIIKSKGVV